MKCGDKLVYPFAISIEQELTDDLYEQIVSYIMSRPYRFVENGVITALATVDEIKNGRIYMTVTHINKEYYENN